MSESMLRGRDLPATKESDVTNDEMRIVLVKLHSGGSRNMKGTEENNVPISPDLSFIANARNELCAFCTGKGDLMGEKLLTPLTIECATETPPSSLYFRGLNSLYIHH